MGSEELFNGEPVITFGHETDRRAFLRWAGVIGAGSALVGTGTLFGSGASAAPAATKQVVGKQAAATSLGKGDLGILNYALTLEYLEYTFYATGLSKNLLKGRDLELVTPIRSHEQQHVQAVMGSVRSGGGTPVAKPKITIPSSVFASADSFLATAVKFEELGVTAYHGQVPLISSLTVLGAAASIAGVESRHAAILESLTNGTPFPNPIEKHQSMSQVLAAVKPYVG